MTFFKLYLVALVIFLLVDLCWLGIIAKNLYREELGYIMAKDVRYGAALLFYLLYIGGLLFFAIMPGFGEGRALMGLFYGAFFGLIAYATYDLTNLATLKGWPMKIVICDLIWGTFISGITSFITVWIGTHWKHLFS